MDHTAENTFSFGIEPINKRAYHHSGKYKKRCNTTQSGYKITKEIFSNDSFSLISGIIFSPYSFVRNKENIKDGLYLVKNPYANASGLQ